MMLPHHRLCNYHLHSVREHCPFLHREKLLIVPLGRDSPLAQAICINLHRGKEFEDHNA
jgi:hypothetical protein